MTLNLAVVTTSTRPGRKGPIIADWFVNYAAEEGTFEVVPVDLADIALPLLDEPEHPMKGLYTKDHTKRWSALIQKADAVVFVMPEYNYLPPASFINAVDFLHREWHYKPVGFVSYAGMSGGSRAVQAAKPLVTTLKAMPIPEGVFIPNFFAHLGEAGFTPTEQHVSAAKLMSVELAKWTTALKPLRG
jgi:NAD(P)H-dependent FMN reductase